jgi:hypothetical protein
MRVGKWIIGIAAFILLPSLHAFQYSGDRQARAGDIGAGEQIQSNDQGVVLNTTPCDSSQTRIVFHRPYRIIREDQGACKTPAGVREYRRLQIEQQ